MGKLLWSGIVMVLLVSGCGWNGTPTRENDITPLTSITITAEYSTIAVNTTTKLTVEGYFSGYFKDDVTDQVTWEVMSGDVAFNSVVPNRVKGVTAGAAVVRATVKGVVATIPITVSSAAISSVAVTPLAPSVPKGLTQQFKAVGTFLDGTTTTTQDITFDAVWSSQDETVAKITTSGGLTGLATTADVLGTSTITAEFTDGSGKKVSDSTVMTVTAPVVNTITVSPPNPSVLSVATRQFTATGTYSDGTTADITSLVSWNSSNGTLATMSGSVATTLAPGTLTISAAKDGAIGNTTLTVTGGSLSSISVTPATPVLVKDTKTRITATGTFTNGRTRDITGAVTWTTTDTQATVAKAGGNLAWLTAVSGTTDLGTTITAAVAGKEGAAILKVSTPPTPVVLSIAITPVSPTLIAGTSSQLTATATFNSTSTTQDVTYSNDSINNSDCSWSTDNPAVATVGNDGFTKGRVTALAAGTAVVTATYGGKESSTTVTVTTAPTLLSVAVSCPAVSVGNKVSCTVTATYSGLPSKDVTRDATAWTVGSENILAVADSINQPGDVIGVSGGSTTLTATFGGITAPTVTIIVTP